jgi:putative FmdB family regulatory protein
MPTYEYACRACAHQWEVVQRITEDPVQLCPACKRNEAHRLISRGTNFILKGGGWYSDLYASPKAPAQETAKESDKAEPATPAATQSANAETKKSETKLEPKTANATTEAPAPSRTSPPVASSS